MVKYTISYHSLTGYKYIFLFLVLSDVIFCWQDDDSDLEHELEAFPAVSGEDSTEAAACVKVYKINSYSMSLCFGLYYFRSSRLDRWPQV